jgi:hypothetical protein
VSVAKAIAAVWLGTVAAYRLATIPPTNAGLALAVGWLGVACAIALLASAAATYGDDGGEA